MERGKHNSESWQETPAGGNYRKEQLMTTQSCTPLAVCKFTLSLGIAGLLVVAGCSSEVGSAPLMKKIANVELPAVEKGRGRRALKAPVLKNIKSKALNVTTGLE
jgi:hypothetical protein